MGNDNLFKKKRERNERDLKRKASVREPNEVILIVCEGEKTECNYLKTLKDSLKIQNARIEINGSSDSAPISVVEFTNKIKDKKKYDCIYCVFDKDTHTSFDEAINEIDKNKTLKHIVSSPCFEYWILLHFEYTTKSFGQNGASSCQELIDKCLKKHLKDYCKNYKFSSIINTNIKTAIDNAKKAYENARKNDFKTSYTEMHILVDKFLELQSKQNNAL